MIEIILNVRLIKRFPVLLTSFLDSRFGETTVMCVLPSSLRVPAGGVADSDLKAESSSWLKHPQQPGWSHVIWKLGLCSWPVC